MTKTETMKKFNVTVEATVYFPIKVIAKDKDEALDKCRENIKYDSIEVYSDSVSLVTPDDYYSDDDDTNAFEDGEDYSITVDDILSFDADDETEDVELYYTDEEEEEDEPDDADISYKYEDLIMQIKGGKGCDDCPLYHNGFCNKYTSREDYLPGLCGDILYHYLNDK